jgi:hypothetical protein
MTGDQTAPALEFAANTLHRLQSRNAQSLQSRAESISCGSRQRHSGVPQLWSCIQHRAEAVEVVEALSELAGVGCQMMGFQLSCGSINDQIELGDLLYERDLILAGEQIGLKLLELLLRRLMRLISFANDAAGPSM